MDQAKKDVLMKKALKTTVNPLFYFNWLERNKLIVFILIGFYFLSDVFNIDDVPKKSAANSTKQTSLSSVPGYVSADETSNSGVIGEKRTI